MKQTTVFKFHGWNTTREDRRAFCTFFPTKTKCEQKSLRSKTKKDRNDPNRRNNTTKNERFNYLFSFELELFYFSHLNGSFILSRRRRDYEVCHIGTEMIDKKESHVGS